MRDLKISYGNSRFAKKWPNKTTTFNEFCDRLKIPKRTTETVAEYKKMSKDEQSNIKDVGGYVLGHLKGNRRSKETVDCRSAITLDADDADTGFIDRIEMLYGFKCVIYSTHKHTPEMPRLRVVIPMSRDVTPDEYSAVSRLVAASIGMDYFDDSTYQPQRLMYWPSVSSDGEYLYKEIDGDILDPDVYLSQLSDWRDCSLWPTSSRQSTIIQTSKKQQEDPLEKTGTVGAFCRAYPIEEAIETFLSGIYEPSAIEGRYNYIPADSSAGVVIYDGKWAYSHHATDPACERLLNAFDLVRVHKFPAADEKASFKQMCEFACNDANVKAQLLEEKQREAETDFEGDDWESRLEYEKSSKLKNSLHNITLIMQNDPNLKGIVFNQLADGMEIKDEVPWKHPARFWRDADDAQLISYVDERYGSFSKRNYDIAVTKVTDDRSYHPIREMFEALPEWDGVPRVDTLLIDYLGAEDNAYVRAVTRKAICAAHIRVYNPGVKFDNIVVLNGEQGIGKSTLIAALGMEWYSDSLNLSDMNDKTAAEKLQGYWILEIGELAGMKKADIDKVKAFISRQDDKYRASFGRRVTPHPRQCIFIGTTNNENGYLRDITGNRRFWNVRLSGMGKWKPWDLTNDVVKQVWAEAILLAKAGEKLYLDANLEAYAKEEQRKAMEQDEREGIVRDYLELLLPDNWEKMSIYDRRDYVREPDSPTHPKGTVKRQSVSNIEIWCECFGKSKEELRPMDSYAISAIMARIEGWSKSGVRQILPIYGRQRMYVRTT